MKKEELPRLYFQRLASNSCCLRDAHCVYLIGTCVPTPTEENHFWTANHDEAQRRQHLLMSRCNVATPQINVDLTYLLHG